MRIDNPMRGERILVRNYEKSDLEFLTGMWFHEENGKYMSDPTAEYVDQAYQKALDTLGESRLGYYLVIVLADTGESVGSFCMFPDERGGEKVTAEVAVGNLASNALLRKFGFAVERRAEFSKYHMDVRFDSYIYAKVL